MGWRHFLVAGLVAAVAFVLAPGGSVVEVAVFVAWTGAAAVAFAVGVRRHRPQPAWLWRLFIVANAIFWLASAGSFSYPLVTGREVPFPSPLDPLYWLALLSWIVSLIGIVRRRAREDRGAVFDGLIVAAGVAVAIWKIVVEPLLGADMSVTTVATTATYLVLLTLLTAAAIHATVVPGRVRTVQVLLLGAVLVGLAAAIWITVTRMNEVFAYRELRLAGLLSAFTLLGAAGLHPQLPSLTAGRGLEPAHRRRVRLAVLFLAGIVPLVAMSDVAAMNHSGDFDDTLVLLIVGVLVVGAVVVRLSLSAGDLTEQQQLRGQLEHAASHDQLTGLTNRAGFDPALRHALAIRHDADHAAMVLLADLDGFKAVNDTYGHQAGDELLRQVAARLADGVRDGDTVARLGGDEFAIVVDDIDLAEGLALADRLATAINQPIDIGPATPAISVSIGVYRPESGDDPDEVMRRADTAMYAAKSAGGGVQLFEADRHRGFLGSCDLPVGERTTRM